MSHCGIVKLTKGSSIDPQDTGLQPVANPPCWASKAVASLNLTMPLHALFGMMRLDLSAPDSTTLSRRSQHLTRRLRLVPPGEGLHLVLGSTGLSIVGAGEWAAAKHGGRGRRGWRKLHLGVDQSGVIRVHTLTEATGEDATTALDLLNAVEGPLVRVTADAAYGTVAVYETARVRRSSSHRPRRRTSLATARGRPRGIGRSRW